MWRVSALFLFGSLAVAGWLSVELGLWRSPELSAAEAPAANCGATSEALESLQRSLNERGKALEAKETDLHRREQELKDKETLLADQAARYERSLEETRGRIAEAESLKSARVQNWRRIYEKMDPQRAAHILDSLEMASAVQILSAMKPDQAAEILGRMSNERARAVTEKILGRS